MSWNLKGHCLEVIRGSHLLPHAVDQGWLIDSCLIHIPLWLWFILIIWSFHLIFPYLGIMSFLSVLCVANGSPVQVDSTQQVI